MISPRLVIVILWLTSDVLSRAFDSWFLPFAGFFLLPWTTLTYVAARDWWRLGHRVEGIGWFFVALPFFIDLGSYAGGRRAR